MGFFPSSISFQFRVNKSDVSAPRNSPQNAAVQKIWKQVASTKETLPN